VIHFRIALNPRGQGRPRAAKRGNFIAVYKDAMSRVHEDTIASLAAQYRPASPLTGPLRVKILVITSRPLSAKNWSAKKPDVDNFEKAVLDALQAFWVDDCQVADLHAQKVVAAWGESPGFEIWIDAAGLEPGGLADAVALADEVM